MSWKMLPHQVQRELLRLAQPGFLRARTSGTRNGVRLPRPEEAATYIRLVNAINTISNVPGNSLVGPSKNRKSKCIRVSFHCPILDCLSSTDGDIFAQVGFCSMREIVSIAIEQF